MWSKALARVARRMIRSGTLQLTLPDGTTQTLGDGTGAPVAVTIHDEKTARGLILNPELAVGEGYMDGTLTVEDDDLEGFLALAVLNQRAGAQTRWQSAVRRLRTATRSFMQNNVPGLSRKNVAHHYDLAGDLYALFLDADRQYSCAYFTSPDDTLEEAQAHKKAHIARKLALEPGMRVLDIGCGWGGMALTLARDHGARVLGITLSEEQLAVARQRAKEERLEDRVDFRLADYRDLTGSFDRIVSVGMFEHVGLPYYDTYFGKIRDLLTADGVALIHTIGISDAPSGTNPWIAKYIFPGGYVPSLSEVVASIERQGVWMTDIEILRLHYAETLRHWRERFEANRDRIAALYDERFVRMWRFYLVACETSFRHRRQTVFQVQIARRIDALPITRDYLYERPVSQAARVAAE
jgi:cyclopropane-fatty-acyl-phospholipid synthase